MLSMTFSPEELILHDDIVCIWWQMDVIKAYVVCVCVRTTVSLAVVYVNSLGEKKCRIILGYFSTISTPVSRSTRLLFALQQYTNTAAAFFGGRRETKSVYKEDPGSNQRPEFS